MKFTGRKYALLALSALAVLTLAGAACARPGPGFHGGPPPSFGRGPGFHRAPPPPRRDWRPGPPPPPYWGRRMPPPPPAWHRPPPPPPRYWRHRRDRDDFLFLFPFLFAIAAGGD